MTELARAEQPKNFETLKQIRDNLDAPPAVRTDCAWKIHIIGYGKPTETLRMQGAEPVSAPVFNIRRMEPGEFKASTETGQIPPRVGNGQSDPSHTEVT